MPFAIPSNYLQASWTDENTTPTHRPKGVSDQVFDQLRELIFRGDYPPGQQIMTERELAKALNVNRNSVRESINKLVTLRFLSQRQGQGTFVRSLDEAVTPPGHGHGSTRRHLGSASPA